MEKLKVKLLKDNEGLYATFSLNIKEFIFNENFEDLLDELVHKFVYLQENKELQKT